MSTSALASFNFNTNEVRTINKDASVWFVASDIAKALEYRTANDMTRWLDEDEADTHIVSIRSENGVEQNREVTIINESGMYHAILKSRKPVAKVFRKWVTSEVLPAIRKTGSYTAPMAKDMLGEISQRMNERFPDGKHRPYAWSRFNNHFRLASYKDLPAHKFDEAKAYIAQMPTNDECRAIMQSKPTDTITIPRSTWGMITDTLTMLQRATANS